MDDVKSLDGTSLWKNCPTEILLMIFEMLDVKTLINCMIVCEKWWNVSNDIIKHINYERVIKLALLDKGASFRKKSKLNNFDMILNLSLWQEIYFTLPQNSHIYPIKGVLSLNVYKDNIIVVTHWKVKYFDLRNHKLIKTLPITCIDFDENDYMFIKMEVTYFTNDSAIAKFRNMTLYGKDHEDSDMDSNKVYAHESVLTHRLHENCCYFTLAVNCIFVASWSSDTWLTRLVSVHFVSGTIIDLNVYQEGILALLSWGGLFQVDKGGIKIKRNKRKRKRSSVVFEIPKYSFDASLYGKSGAIASVPWDYPFCLKKYEPDYWVMECPDLSCTLKHGNMLLLGFNTGRVNIFNPIKFEQEIVCKILVPQFSLSVDSLAGKEVTDPAVRRLEVAEVKGAHVLLIATSSYVFQVTLNYRLTKECHHAILTQSASKASREQRCCECV